MIKERLFSLILVLSMLISLAACASSLPTASLPEDGDDGYIPVSSEPLSLSLLSDAAFVYDVKNECFLYLSGEDEILYPASTTKLLTILCAMRLLSPDEVVTPTDELSLLGENSTIAYIKAHHSLTVEMLVEGMLLPSGNDAALVLAAAAGRKLSDDPDITGVEAVRLFVDEMNAYASSLGLVGSNFTSPDGYFDSEHYSTVCDMAIIAREAYSFELIRKYASLPSDDVTYASGHTNTWKNTNKCLDPDSEYYSPLVNGLKTGSAGKGNYSLIASFTSGKDEYIVGLFRGKGENDRYSDILSVIDSVTK